MKALYTATATASGDGRNGHTTTDDGQVDTDVRMPPELGGPGGATNPEQLFAAGYAACFLSALKVVAAPEGVDVSGAEVTTRVGIGLLPGGGFGLSAEVGVRLPAASAEQAQSLAEKALGVCPYSTATQGNVDTRLTVL
jgi:Ohr subfamily peroxiredoxin